MARFTQIGAPGSNGAAGLGIAKIEKTKTEGLVDTYTITYTNGTITTFSVTNGTGVTSIESDEHYENGEYTVTPIMFNKNDGTTNVVNVIAKNGVGGSGSGATNNAILTATNTSGWRSKTIATGSDCIVTFVWDSKEEGEETGNGIVKITVNNVVRTSYEVEQGEVPVDLTNYLTLGTNTIQIEVSDVYLNSRVMGFTVNCVSINMTSAFDATRAYTGSIDFRYVPVGNISKTVHFKMDGTEIHTVTTETNGREQQYTIPAQSHGSHTFEVYFSCTINGSYTESNHLYYDLICYEEGNTDPIVATPFRDATVEQYSTVAIPYSVYTPGFEYSNVTLKVNGEEVSNITVDRKQQTWSYKVRDYEDVTLTIVSGSATKTINLTVTESSMNVAATTENLVLYLTSNGRSNNEENPDTWTYGSTEAMFNDKFNWESDGWKLDENNNTVLRVAGDARVYIPFFIFEQDCRTNGKTIEIEFATRDVLNYDATIISSWSGDRGIKITAQKATIKSEQSEISTQYKEDETVRVSFAVNKSSDHRLLTIYINGIMSGVIQYATSDDFSQVPAVGISIGSNDCTTDIYCIRVYDSELTSYQILDNWIADTQDLTTMYDRYTRNDIYDSYDNISISKLPNYLPYMILDVSEYSSLPQRKGDKKTINGSYVDNLYPERSFTFTGAEIDVQGTSSQYYPRKNYKIKFNNGFVINGNTVENYCLRSTSVPTNEFTFKADVASSEGANNVELVRLYDDTCPVKTPPQEIDPRVRQGIEGYPIVMFYGTGDNYTFLGKYNFNNDKATGEVFGMEEGDESWEILQNNTQMAVWKDANFSDDNWKKTFEARYPEDNVETSNLQLFATWLVSTDTTKATNEVLQNRISYEWTVTKSTRVPGTYDIINSSCTYNTDSEEYRIAKFRTEFSRYANVDAMLFNYIFTETFLMIDNRAKNAFPTRYDEDGKWVILPYDYDSAIGIDNEGALKFGYELEDTDLINGETQVFNGQESVLYNNMRLAFADEIADMYHDLRVGDVFSYEEIEKRFEDHQEVWSEAIYNEDARFKYIDPLVNENNGEYLKMLQGSKAEQRKWWLYNRFRYLDSKYNAGDSLEDYILLRTYGKADIEVTPYADIYASAKFDEILVQKRALRGNTYILENPLDDGNHGVLSIFSASQLSSIGDLSGLKLSMCDFTMATKLSELKIGSDAEGYVNPNLTEVYVGNLTLLKKIDVRNCSNLTQSVDLSGCTNIEEVYFDGTAITGVQLPNGGSLKKLHLPGTIVSLELMNQPQLTELVVPNYSNISSLRIENMSKSIIDTLAVVRNLSASSRVRLLGVDWAFNSVSEAKAIMDKLDTFRGLDEQGNNTDKAVVTGKIHVPSITREELDELRGRYPNLTVEYDEMTVKVTFYNGAVVFNEQYLVTGSSIRKPSDPTKASTAQYHFNFAGWSLDGVNVIDITGATIGENNITYYAVYTEELRYYTVTFTNSDGTVLQTLTAAYGSIPVYTGDYPIDPSGDDGEFLGWDDEIVEVVGDVTYIAMFIEIPKLSYTLTTGSNATYAVTGIGTVTDTDIVIPDTYKGKNVTRIDAGAFKNNTTIESVTLGKNIIVINNDAFNSCSELIYIDASSSSLTNVGRWSFGSCNRLTKVTFPSTISKIDQYAFYSCRGLLLLDFRLATAVPVVEYKNFISTSSGGSLDPKIVVPDNLYDTWITTSYWGEYADRIIKSSEYEIKELEYALESNNTSYYVKGVGTIHDENITIPNEYNGLPVTRIFSISYNGILKSITIPNTVTEIMGLNECPRLNEVTVLATTPPTLSSNSFGNASSSMIIYVPAESVDIYKAATNWSKFADRIQAMPTQGLTYTLNSDNASYTVTGIGTATVTDIVIPNTYKGLPVTEVASKAFEHDTTITSITVGDNVTTLRSSCFEYASSLASITIGRGVTLIERNVYNTVKSTDDTVLYVLATTPPTIDRVSFYIRLISVIYVPAESVDAYKSATNWSNYADKIQPIPEA